MKNDRQGTLKFAAVASVMALWIMAFGALTHAADEEGNERDAHAEKAHGVHEQHSGHDEHSGGALTFSKAELEEFGVELAKAGPGTLNIELDLPAEVRLNQDRVAHVVPKLSGIVREVNQTVRDSVTQGERMALLDSRELADAKSAYLAAHARLRIETQNYQREKRLWEQKISPEQDYLDAKQRWEEAKIAVDSAEQKLHALGLTQEEVDRVPEQPDTKLTEYRMRAPFAGLVIEKHIVLGEFLEANATAFTIADLSTVWVDITVYREDLARVLEGQTVIIDAGGGDVAVATDKIEYVIPIVGEQTRTATARVVLPNPKGEWRPGLFVNAHVQVDTEHADVLVPRDAVQTIDDKPHIFVKTEHGLEPRAVELGRTTVQQAEILSGLKAGETYAAKNAFSLKAELGKGSFGGHHH